MHGSTLTSSTCILQCPALHIWLFVIASCVPTPGCVKPGYEDLYRFLPYLASHSLSHTHTHTRTHTLLPRQVELKKTKRIYAMKVIKKELVMDEEVRGQRGEEREGEERGGALQEGRGGGDHSDIDDYSYRTLLVACIHVEPVYRKWVWCDE